MIFICCDISTILNKPISNQFLFKKHMQVSVCEENLHLEYLLLCCFSSLVSCILPSQATWEKCKHSHGHNSMYYYRIKPKCFSMAYKLYKLNFSYIFTWFNLLSLYIRLCTYWFVHSLHMYWVSTLCCEW